MQSGEKDRTDGRTADEWENLRCRLLQIMRRKFWDPELAEEKAQNALCFVWHNAQKTGLSTWQVLRYSIRHALCGSEFGTTPNNHALCALRGKSPHKKTAPQDWAVFSMDGHGHIPQNGKGKPVGIVSVPSDTVRPHVDHAPETIHKIDCEVWTSKLTRLQRDVLGCLRAGVNCSANGIHNALGVSHKVACRVLGELRESVPPQLLVRPCKGNGGGR